MHRILGLLCPLPFIFLMVPAAMATESLSEVFQRVNASVVVIHTSERTPTPQTETGFTSVAGLGSGVLISAAGQVMTAAHVVQAADAVEVEFLDGPKVLAKVVSSAPDADVALLQLEQVPSGAIVAELGDSDQVEVGERDAGRRGGRAGAPGPQRAPHLQHLAQRLAVLG